MNHDIPLGKTTEYYNQYKPELLFPVARQIKRDELGLTDKLPFFGCDIWNAYEMSWLNTQGKPQAAIGVFEFSSDSENIIESKSFKLYLNSFNQTPFESWQQVKKTLSEDLTAVAKGIVEVKLFTLQEYNKEYPITEWDAMTIDDVDVEISQYDYQASLLAIEHTKDSSQEIVEEKLTSDLLKSNCLITNQPDWASILIQYKGAKIHHESLLKYLISFRTHNEFHEQCVERVFTDIMEYCKPQELTVYARYTRRGGLDINPFRTNIEGRKALNLRLVRQ